MMDSEQQTEQQAEQQLSVEEYKFESESEYAKSLRSRTSRPSRNYKRHSGNTTSESGSRPPAYKAGAQDLKDIVNYRAADYIQTRSAYRKTAAPKIVPYNPQGGQDMIHQPVNQQHHPVVRQRLLREQQRNLHRSWIVELPQIRPWLFLTTVEAVLVADFLQVNNLSSPVIINLSSHKFKLLTAKVYHVGIEDCRNISHSIFWSWLRRVIDTIRQYPKSAIVLCCDKGVNRSVAAAIGYAMLSGVMNYQTAYDYIVATKQVKYGSAWSSLNNNMFSKHLQLPPVPLMTGAAINC